MNRLLNYVAALLLLPVSMEAQDYSKYYQNLPVEVKQVSRPVIPANEINIKDVGWRRYRSEHGGLCQGYQ